MPTLAWAMPIGGQCIASGRCPHDEGHRRPYEFSASTGPN